MWSKFLPMIPFFGGGGVCSVFSAHHGALLRLFARNLCTSHSLADLSLSPTTWYMSERETGLNSQELQATSPPPQKKNISMTGLPCAFFPLPHWCPSHNPDALVKLPQQGTKTVSSLSLPSLLTNLSFSPSVMCHPEKEPPPFPTTLSLIWVRVTVSSEHDCGHTRSCELQIRVTCQGN